MATSIKIGRRHNILTGAGFAGISEFTSLDLTRPVHVHCDDWSQLRSLAGFFAQAKCKKIVLPSGFGSVATNLNLCFYGSSALQSLTLPDGFGKVATATATTFYGCNKLTTITGNPNFKVSVDFSSCPLTTDSAMVIINGLQTVTTTQTLTLKTSTFNALTDEQKAVATAKSWSLAYKN